MMATSHTPATAASTRAGTWQGAIIRAALAMFLLAALSALAALAALAQVPLELTGPLTQGGLVTGRTAPGARVTIDGRPVRVAEDGLFLIGFGRDHGPEARLSVALPNGRSITRTLAIEPRKYDIQRIDGLPEAQVTPPPEVLARIQAENAEVALARKGDTAMAFFRGGFAWPALGRISGVYGSQRILNGQPRQPHYGVDIAAPRGSRVTAPADGIVVLAHPDMYFTGKTLIIDHGHGLFSTLIHMDQITVQPGEFVKQGQRVGTVGASGRATGPHLDWRVNLFDQRLDPQLLVGPMPAAK